MTFLRRAARVPELPIILMTIGVFIVSAIFASGSVGVGALSTMLPLAGILMIASTGQSLVIQQRGIDLSGAAMISLSAVIVSVYCHGDGGRLPAAVVIAIVAGALAGLVNGVMVVIGLIPIVATLAMYQLLYGVNKTYGKDVSQSVPKGLANFSIGSVLGVPNVLLIAVLVVLVAAVMGSATRVGHRFVSTGVNRDAAIVVGSKTKRQLLSAYVLCSVMYAVAGALLAGYVTTPSSTIGDTYLLAPIAVVVLAGNSFGTAKVSIIATALGALFYTQLGQFTLSLGAPTSSQFYIQSIGIMALPVTRFTLGVVRRSRERNTTPGRPARVPTPNAV